MTIDKAQLRVMAEAAIEIADPWYTQVQLQVRAVDPEPAALMAATTPEAVLDLLAEIEQLEFKQREANMLVTTSGKYAYECQQERDKLRAELAGLRTGYEAQNNVIAGLKAENEDLRMHIKEMDLMFGRYLLGMRASVIEWQDGKGADAAMHWIWNGLAGPGELPPPDEKEAQPYFDREVVQIDNAQQEVFAYWDLRRTEKAKESSQ